MTDRSCRVCGHSVELHGPNGCLVRSVDLVRHELWVCHCNRPKDVEGEEA